VSEASAEEIRRAEAAAQIKEIWRSPLIPSDPLVWRKELDADIKSKLYTFVMTYGRIGTPEEVAEARKVLDTLQWAPFRPSSDAQLYPIRILALNKDMLKVRGDEKMSDDEKKAKLAELQKKADEISKLAETVPGM
jgi:phosphonate transport system substrate-binding protein